MRSLIFVLFFLPIIGFAQITKPGYRTPSKPKPVRVAGPKKFQGKSKIIVVIDADATLEVDYEKVWDFKKGDTWKSDISAGEHVIRLHNQYGSWQNTVETKSGQQKIVKTKLQPTVTAYHLAREKEERERQEVLEKRRQDYLNNLFNSGLSYFQDKSYSNAITKFNVLLSESAIGDSLEYWGHYYLGYCHDELGNDDSVYDVWSTCIELRPNDAGFLNNFAWWLVERERNLSHANEMAAKSNRLRPDNMYTEDTYAWVLYKLGKYYEAKIWMEKALEHGGKSNKGYLERYSQILAANGETLLANEYMKKSQGQIFSDDFSGGKSSFWTGSNDYNVTKVTNGVFQFKTLKDQDRIIWKEIDMDFSRNYQVSMDVAYVSGTDSRGNGFSFQVDEDGNRLFTFNISGNKQYTIGQKKNGNWSNLKSWTKGLVKSGFNNMTVQKKGNVLKFFLNGTLVHTDYYQAGFGNRLWLEVTRKCTVQFDNILIEYLD